MEGTWFYSYGFSCLLIYLFSLSSISYCDLNELYDFELRELERSASIWGGSVGN